MSTPARHPVHFPIQRPSCPGNGRGQCAAQDFVDDATALLLRIIGQGPGVDKADQTPGQGADQIARVLMLGGRRH